VSHEFAQQLVRASRYVFDERDARSEHQPSTRRRSAQYKHHDIEAAAAHLRGMIEAHQKAARVKC
jgi:hypothetical protein